MENRRDSNLEPTRLATFAFGDINIPQMQAHFRSCNKFASKLYGPYSAFHSSISQCSAPRHHQALQPRATQHPKPAPPLRKRQNSAPTPQTSTLAVPPTSPQLLTSPA